jgi:phage terminase large subunit
VRASSIQASGIALRPSQEAIARAKATAPAVGGIDFGFKNPFAAVYGHLDHDDRLWITGLRYKSQCTMPVHSEALPKGVQWWADPSGAESIQQLRQAGHSVRPCVHMPRRGASGENQSPKIAGIDQVSERMRTGRLWIVRTPETMPLIRELGMYHYDETKKVEEPVDEDNHACDALRYLIVGIDRGRSVPVLNAPETEAEREAKERNAASLRKFQDRQAESDPFASEWGWQ